MTVEIREAHEDDAVRVCKLFQTVYGDDYPFKGFYDPFWLKKAVFDDNTLFLIAESEGHLLATGSVMYDGGNDLVGELGRLVAAPTKRAAGAAGVLVTELLKRSEDRAQFLFGEVRTVHRGSQKLGEKGGCCPMGFAPMKYQFTRRESVVMMGRVTEDARQLRRNNPRVIPEAAHLAQTALSNLGFTSDVIVDDQSEGYPTEAVCQIERLTQEGLSPLLRIERGRVRGKEIFGKFSLLHGFFCIPDTTSHYLVARDGAAVLGAIGFTFDPIDKKIRVLEVIDFNDAVKGYLLAEMDRIAREEFGAFYQEVDVSAYSPQAQRTLQRLGFVPSAYCPAMVFADVERLDIVRMIKVNGAYDVGELRLLQGGQAMRSIVEKELEDRMIGLQISEVARHAQLFEDLPEGELHRLTRIGLRKNYPAQTTLIRQGQMPDRLYLLETGNADVLREGKIIGKITEGGIFGEMALLQKTARAADVILTEESTVVEFDLERLERMMQLYPRLGYAVMQNMARSLSEKLRQAND